MVASKFLNDDGEEDEVFNDEWAISGGLEKKELNRMELDFLSAIDWKIYVTPEDYEHTAENLEYLVAAKKVQDRGGLTTYSDCLALSRPMELIKIWEMLYEYTIKVTAVCAFAYAASLMTMVSTCHMLSQSQVFGPTSLQHSLDNLWMWKTKKEPTETNNNASFVETHESIEEVINDRLMIENTLAMSNASSEELPTTPLPLPTCQEFTYYSDPNEFVKENQNLLVNRLSRSILALKLGTFRDLMLGPRSFLPGQV